MAYGFNRPPTGLKATVERTGRIPTLADELIAAVRAGRVEVVPTVTAFESNRVILADGSGIPAAAVIAATGFSMDLEGLIGSLGVLDEKGKLPGGFASHVGNGIFAIGYGIPPNGPLRAIRRATPPSGPQDRHLLARRRARNTTVRSATPTERNPLNSRFN